MAKKKVIDWELAEKAAALFCTGEEIASLCKVSYDTLKRRIDESGYNTFAEWYDQKTADTRKSLRRKQLDLALKGDRVMLIWLGKNILKQVEKNEMEVTNKEIKIDVFSNENPLRKNAKTG